MDTMITRDILLAHNVCKEGLAWFDGAFPHGCRIDDLFAYEGGINARYVWWYYLNIKRDERLLLLCKIYDSLGVHKSSNIVSSQGISKSNDLRRVNGVHWSKNASISSGIDGSENVKESKGISWSKKITKAAGISNSENIYNSSAISNSHAVYNSRGINNSFGILNSVGVSNALFTANRKQEYTIFDKPVTKERFDDVKNQLFKLLHKWLPDYSKPVPWKKIPAKALDYILALPEFDANIFKEITNIDLTKQEETDTFQDSVHEILSKKE